MPTRVPVQALIPDVREVTATSVSALDQLTAIKNVMSTPGRRWQVGPFATSGSQVTALVLEYGSIQLCMRAVSTTELLVSLHPEGGVTDANSPVTATGSPERSINGYVGTSSRIGTTNLLTLTTGKIQIGEFEGAITIFFKDSLERWVAGIHAGQIYYGDNENDEQNGFDGMGILIGRPGIMTVNVGNYIAYTRGLWLNQQYSYVEAAKISGSIVRVPENLWVTPSHYGVANQFTLETNASIAVPNDVNNGPRLQPIKIGVRSTSSSRKIEGIIGSLRFMRNTLNPPTQILDSDQYWSSNYPKNTTTSTGLAISYEARNLVFAWNKNYIL
jgi:hypothetical protein